MRTVILLVIIIFVALVCSCSKGLAQVDSSKQEELGSSEQIAVLRAELKLMESYSAKLMSTVYWSLGVVSTITILLIGFGWFVNFRVYERDKEILRNELEYVLQSKIVEIRNEVENDIAERFEEISEEINSDFEKKTEQVEWKISNLSYNLMRIEAERWYRKDVIMNEFRVRCDMLELSIDSKTTWQISRTLDDMRDTLMRMKDQLTSRKTGIKLDAALIERYTEVSKKVPKGFEIAISDLDTLVSSIRAL